MPHVVVEHSVFVSVRPFAAHGLACLHSVIARS
jgi:hypothetical protein